MFNSNASVSLNVAHLLPNDIRKEIILFVERSVVLKRKMLWKCEPFLALDSGTSYLCAGLRPQTRHRRCRSRQVGHQGERNTLGRKAAQGKRAWRIPGRLVLLHRQENMGEHRNRRREKHWGVRNGLRGWTPTSKEHFKQVLISDCSSNRVYFQFNALLSLDLYPVLCTISCSLAFGSPPKFDIKRNVYL